MVLNTEWAQVEVIDLINDGSGLAFGIIGGRSTGVVVKTILPGGVADRDGRLQSGDHILQIGEVNLRGLGSEQVASVLRQCGIHVRMVVARPVESTSTDYQALGSHAPIVPTKILGDPAELDRHLIENGLAETFAHPPSNYPSPFIYSGQNNDIQLHPISGLVDVVKNPLPIGNVPVPKTEATTVGSNMLPLDMALREPNLPETLTYTVQLEKDDLGLGITVAGYVCEKEEISGIFVKSISKGGAADLTHKIKINDRIVQVDGKSIVGQTNHQAVEILRNTGAKVTIKFERYLRGPKYEQLQQAIKANELRPPSPISPTVTSLPKVPLSQVKMSYLGIEPEQESRTSLDFDSAVLFDAPSNGDEKEIVIDNRRSIQFSISSHESIHEKWKEKLRDDVQIVIAQMDKDPNSGLGISLEGTVDVEDGREVRPHHYIRNILPDGPVGRNGALQPGDELLEVNGIQLLGLNHLEVVSILKQLPNFVSLVCARYPVPIRIIDTSQRREAFQSRKIIAGSLQTLIPSNERLVKAKSESSLNSSAAASDHCQTGSRSRSLEMIAGFPMWSEEPVTIELTKGDHGLGFSILDYQDPLNPQETVIVVRSLVPGGVAQSDGRLIPGDRLLAVNGVVIDHASLDRAVQVLKGAPKGIVALKVAKPLGVNDGFSYTSQDTEDDQTCLEDFQECIEEYQECLEVVQICIEEDQSFNNSPSMSQVEDFGEKPTKKDTETLPKPFKDFVQDEVIRQTRESIGDSDAEISFKSTNGTIAKFSEAESKANGRKISAEKFEQKDKSYLTHSSNHSQSEKDDYDTCMDDSLSEDNSKLNQTKRETEVIKDNHTIVQNIPTVEERINEEETPTNSKGNLSDQTFAMEFQTKMAEAVSEPSLNADATFAVSSCKHICLDSKPEDGLKSYDNQSDSLGADEFFLVQYPETEVSKSYSEPNVLDTCEVAPKTRKTIYRRCLKEYYNDYEDCLESYKLYMEQQVRDKKEMSDEEIFSEIYLPFKSRSAPDIMDGSFVMVTYDPGPDMTRRKSAFVPGHQCINNEATGPMTVIRPIENDCGSLRGRQVDNMLEKHWGPAHTVTVHREPNTSLGISIVGGKVDLHSSEKIGESLLGIFVKNVVPNSPAGKTGEFKTGDRIIEVSGIDLIHASHEKAVEAIRNSPNPVTFVVKSLVPWTEQENPLSGECLSPHPSPVNSKSPVKLLCNTDKKQEARQEAPTSKSDQVEAANESSKEESFAIKAEVNSINDGDKKPSVGQLQSLPATPEPESPFTKRIESPTSGDESEEDEYTEDARELEGRTTSAKGHPIDRASAGNVKRTKEEISADPEEEDDFGYTNNKVKKKYASLGHSIIMVQLERSNQGLGLSLAGHKDRNCMAVFVCGLNPKGAAYKAGGIQVGDEILEVNGVVLHGRCHLNASAIIKSLSGPIFKVIILRRKTAIDDIAVKPITQFPVSLAEEASEEQFSSSYPNVRTVAIKKGTQSLGIMIIEGKHAEVGQGIFISDIQAGSAAEKAGLEIGEMILAVNKDSLVGSNYDTAANLLKRTEGLVTLVVSNPGKKDAQSTISNDVGAKTGSKSNALIASRPPSRPSTPVPEPQVDPSSCSILPGTETTIEITSDNKVLGIFFVGGKDTLIPNGIVIVEIYPGGPADKDGRLRPGDQILEVNGTSLKDVTYTTALQTIRQTLPKMKMLIFRPEKIEFSTVDVDLIKKPGKGLGLSIMAKKSGKGLYVADTVNGGAADVDGRIMKGDLIASVNGQSLENSTSDEAGAILKTASGRVSLRLHRYKPWAR